MIPTSLENLLLGAVDPCDRHAAYFDINGQAARVASSTGQTMADLRAFCHPYIPSRDAIDRADSAYQVGTVVDRELYERLTENLPGTADAVLVTSLTHDYEYRLRCFRSESLTVVEDEPLKLFYAISERGRATNVIATTGSRERTGLLRLIRGAWVLSHDAPIVHGCVLEKHGRGIVIAGEKYAGKTTSVLNLCSRRGYSLVANDRLLLERNPSGERLRAIGVPTVVNVRASAVKPFPELQHLLDLPVYGVSDLAKALHAEVTRDTDVAAIAFLSYDGTCGRPQSRRLSREASHEMLASHLLSAREYEWVRLMRVSDGPAAAATAAGRGLLDGVACFHLRGNERHLDDTADLLDRWCQRAD